MRLILIFGILLILQLCLADKYKGYIENKSLKDIISFMITKQKYSEKVKIKRIH